jgi:D-arabinose 1-dehydrogenase-like Zn-dependent alcohol dehydrogenase
VTDYIGAVTLFELVYNALRNADLRGGDLIAVQGIGGLGHLGGASAILATAPQW